MTCGYCVLAFLNLWIFSHCMLEGGCDPGQTNMVNGSGDSIDYVNSAPTIV